MSHMREMDSVTAFAWVAGILGGGALLVCVIFIWTCGG